MRIDCPGLRVIDTREDRVSNLHTSLETNLNSRASQHRSLSKLSRLTSNPRASALARWQLLHLLRSCWVSLSTSLSVTTPSWIFLCHKALPTPSGGLSSKSSGCLKQQRIYDLWSSPHWLVMTKKPPCHEVRRMCPGDRRGASRYPAQNINLYDNVVHP